MPDRKMEVYVGTMGHTVATINSKHIFGVSYAFEIFGGADAVPGPSYGERED